MQKGTAQGQAAEGNKNKGAAGCPVSGVQFIAFTDNELFQFIQLLQAGLFVQTLQEGIQKFGGC